LRCSKTPSTGGGVPAWHSSGPSCRRTAIRSCSGVKPRANEESRQDFLSRYVPKLWDLGIELPDATLAYDTEQQAWQYAEPDWDELRRFATLGVSAGASDRLNRFQAGARDHAWIRGVVTGDLPQAA
jgi:hypothetical protein